MSHEKIIVADKMNIKGCITVYGQCSHFLQYEIINLEINDIELKNIHQFIKNNIQFILRQCQNPDCESEIIKLTAELKVLVNSSVQFEECSREFEINLSAIRRSYSENIPINIDAEINKIFSQISPYIRKNSNCSCKVQLTKIDDSRGFSFKREQQIIIPLEDSAFMLRHAIEICKNYYLIVFYTSRISAIYIFHTSGVRKECKFLKPYLDKNDYYIASGSTKDNCILISQNSESIKKASINIENGTINFQDINIYKGALRKIVWAHIINNNVLAIINQDYRIFKINLEINSAFDEYKPRPPFDSSALRLESTCKNPYIYIWANPECTIYIFFSGKEIDVRDDQMNVYQTFNANQIIFIVQNSSNIFIGAFFNETLIVYKISIKRAISKKCNANSSSQYNSINTWRIAINITVKNKVDQDRKQQKIDPNFVIEIFSLIPIKIMDLSISNIVPSYNSLNQTEHFISQNSSNPQQIQLMSLGYLEQIINNLGSLKVVSIIGRSGTGKSSLLNAIFNASFQSGGGFSTDGVYACLAKAKGRYFFVCDSQGIFNSRVGNETEIKLLIILLSISDFIICDTYLSNISDIIEILKKVEGKAYHNTKIYDCILHFIIRDGSKRRKIDIINSIYEEVHNIGGRFGEKPKKNQVVVTNIHKPQSSKFKNDVKSIFKIYDEHKKFKWYKGIYLIEYIKGIFREVLINQTDAIKPKNVEKETDLKKAEKLLQKVKDMIKTGNGSAYKFSESWSFVYDKKRISVTFNLSEINFFQQKLDFFEFDAVLKKSEVYKELIINKFNFTVKFIVTNFIKFVRKVSKRSIRDYFLRKIEKYRFLKERANDYTNKLKNELKVMRTLSLCIEECEICFNVCTIEKNHSNPDHNCQTDHKCKKKCLFKPNCPYICANHASHSDDCKCNEKHACGYKCSHNDKIDCVREYKHKDEHKCNKEFHYCQSKCDIPICENACAKYDRHIETHDCKKNHKCNEMCSYDDGKVCDKIYDHDGVHECTEKNHYCKNNCLFPTCRNKCVNINGHSEHHNCDIIHKCNAECLHKDNNKCSKDFPHIGEHICSKKKHICQNICSFNCLSACSLENLHSGSHDCGVDYHQCKEKCYYGDNKLCSKDIKHTDYHKCDTKLHRCNNKCAIPTCQGNCILDDRHIKKHNCGKFHQCTEKCSYGDNANCIKAIYHKDEHKCEVVTHYCMKNCKLCTRKCAQEAKHDGICDCGNFHQCAHICPSCNKQCLEDKKNRHTTHKCNITKCPEYCIFNDGKRCSSEDHFHYKSLFGQKLPSGEIGKLHTCENEHDCYLKCQEDGPCRLEYKYVSKDIYKQGKTITIKYKEQDQDYKNYCDLKIPPGRCNHLGDHKCNSHKKLCSEKCPECNAACNLELNHDGLHKSYYHMNKENCVYFLSGEEMTVTINGQLIIIRAGDEASEKMCSCANKGKEHCHLYPCNNELDCLERLNNGFAIHFNNRIDSGVARTNKNYDLVECGEYWKLLGWVPPKLSHSSPKAIFNRKNAHTHVPGLFDIVFIIDVTGSMNGGIQGICGSIKSLINKEQNNNTRFSVVRYTDHTNDSNMPNENPVDVFPRSGKLEDCDGVQFLQFLLANTRVGGGGSNPGEAMVDGIFAAVSLKFRPGVKRIYFIIADSPPNGPEFNDGDQECPCRKLWRPLLQEMRNTDSRLIMVNIGNQLNKTIELFEEEYGHIEKYDIGNLISFQTKLTEAISIAIESSIEGYYVVPKIFK